MVIKLAEEINNCAMSGKLIVVEQDVQCWGGGGKKIIKGGKFNPKGIFWGMAGKFQAQRKKDRGFGREKLKNGPLPKRQCE